ncbi:MAG: hypothetical protein RBQ78_06500 [Acholeplasmataceae bacterium]|jgi:hypothetical protein|nr:hypothetical protein [Acholeplasmataceae bacterium]
MKKNINKISIGLSILSFLIIIAMSVVAILDRFASDMLSAVVVQIGLAAIFIASSICAVLTIKE